MQVYLQSRFRASLEPAAGHILKKLEDDGLPEVMYFLEVFAPGYQQPLDNLLE